VTCSMSMSRSSAGSPTAEAGDCAGARPPWAQRHKPVRIGYDYLHVAIDDRTRLV
jgi:hypothetical protein